MFQWQVCYIQKRNICHSLQYTVENPTVNFNSLCNSCAKFACCSSELIYTILYVGSNIQLASEVFVSCIHLSFVNLALNPTPRTKSKGVRSGDEQHATFIRELRSAIGLTVGFSNIYCKS